MATSTRHLHLYLYSGIFILLFPLINTSDKTQKLFSPLKWLFHCIFYTMGIMGCGNRVCLKFFIYTNKSQTYPQVRNQLLSEAREAGRLTADLHGSLLQIQFPSLTSSSGTDYLWPLLTLCLHFQGTNQTLVELPASLLPVDPLSAPWPPLLSVSFQ